MSKQIGVGVRCRLVGFKHPANLHLNGQVVTVVAGPMPVGTFNWPEYGGPVWAISDKMAVWETNIRGGHGNYVFCQSACESVLAPIDDDRDLSAWDEVEKATGWSPTHVTA